MKYKYFLILVLLAPLLFSGCASVAYTPPMQRSFESSRVYNKSYDEVWIRAVDWFADHNVVIDKMEKDSGLLTARYLINASSSSYLDFGTYQASGTLDGYKVEQQGALNVTVRRIDDKKTKATVNFFGKHVFLAKDGFDGSPL